MASTLTMQFSYVNGIWVCLHNSESPSTEEWLRYCQGLQGTRGEIKAILVFTLGGAPGFKQREQLRAAMDEEQIPPTAVMTNSALARGIITSLNWFTRNQELVAFSSQDIDGALRYLGSRGATIPRDQVLHAMAQNALQLRMRLPFVTQRALDAMAR